MRLGLDLELKAGFSKIAREDEQKSLCKEETTVRPHEVMFPLGSAPMSNQSTTTSRTLGTFADRRFFESLEPELPEPDLFTCA